MALNPNQNRVIKRIAKRMKSDSGPLEPGKEYHAVDTKTSPVSAIVNVSRLLAKPEAQKTLAEYLEVDFPKDKRSGRLKELSEAKKDHVLQDGTKVEIRDNQASLRSLELMMRVCGDIRESGSTNIDARSINYTISATEAAKLVELADKLDRLRGDGAQK